jgi:hypothetical protein
MRNSLKTNQKEEILVRATIRNAIAEAIDSVDALIKKRQKNQTATDVDGDNLQAIAKDLGFSVSGAKQAVDKAMLKAQFLASLNDADRDFLVMSAVKEYIVMLEDAIDPSDPEAPTADDIQLMYDHPEIVATLDDFRYFLHKYVKRAARASGKKIS